MSKFTPKKMMVAGAALLVLGVVFPFLMVLKIVEPSFWLSFLSQACSVIGMFMGFYGLFSHIRIGRQ